MRCLHNVAAFADGRAAVAAMDMVQHSSKHPAADIQQQQGLWQQVLLDKLLEDDTVNSCSTHSDSDSADQAQLVVCKLLSVSKASSNELAERLSGRLPVQFTPTSVEQAEQFAAWLARHGALMGQLHLRSGKWQDTPAFEPCAPILVASALKAAAARSGLQQLRQVVDSMPTPAMLSALKNVSSLTSLVLNFENTRHTWYDDCTWAAQSVGKVANALSGLSQLQALQLDWTGSKYQSRDQLSSNFLWQGLSGLQRLTSLTTAYEAATETQLCTCWQCEQYELLDVQPLLGCGASLQHLTLVHSDYHEHPVLGKPVLLK
jgi:hypothetical protein